jgi:hypothetical protein
MVSNTRERTPVGMLSLQLVAALVMTLLSTTLIQA